MVAQDPLQGFAVARAGHAQERRPLARAQVVSPGDDPSDVRFVEFAHAPPLEGQCRVCGGRVTEDSFLSIIFQPTPSN